MKGAFRGFRSNLPGFASNGRALPALCGLLVWFSTPAFGQVILDNFTASNESKYDFVPVFADPADGWAVTSGQLRPSIDGNASATWFWNQGEKLSAAGQSVSITLSLAADADNGFPSSIGLFLAADRDSINFGHEITQTTIGGLWSYTVDGSGQQTASAPTGPVQLTIQRTGQTVDGFVYTTTFSGGGLPASLTDSFTDASASLLFGPFAYNTAGTGAGLDNLTFTAVPEPSTYAAVFGVLALTMGIIRTRASKRG